MSCVIYPWFQIEIPETLQEVLDNLSNKSLLGQAVQEYQTKKLSLGSGIQYLLSDITFSIWFTIKEIGFGEHFGGDSTVSVKVNTSDKLSERLEDLYINRDLRFVLRGKLLKYKSSGKIYAVEVCKIEPTYKGKPIEEKSKVLSEELVNKLMEKAELFPKSASYYAMPSILDIAKTPQSSSYVNVLDVTKQLEKIKKEKEEAEKLKQIKEELEKLKKEKEEKVQVKSRVNMDEVRKIFDEMILKSGNFDMKNPLDP